MANKKEVTLAGESVQLQKPYHSHVAILAGQDSTGQCVRVLLNADGTFIFTGAISSALPAGTALIGKVGIDQTTPGTTNAVFPIRRGTLVSKSGTCNGTSQTVAAANSSRSYFSFQNPSGNSGTMWADPLGGTAASGSPRIEVEPGKGFAWTGEAVPTNAITVIGTNGEKWTAYEY